MDRRTFIGALTSGFLAGPLTAEGQQPGKVARIGYLAFTEVPNSPTRVAFRDALRALGWVEGQNLIIERRVAGGNSGLLNEQAAELVRLKLDVVVGASTEPAQALMRATKTIPIVFAASADPIGDGLVVSLARPNGNVTGVSVAFEEAFGGKWVQLLKEAIPNCVRVAVLVSPNLPRHGPLLIQAHQAAQSLSLELRPYEARGPDELERAFSRMTRDRVDGLIVFPSGIFSTARRRLAELAVKHRLPAMCEHRLLTEAGGLLSYGPNILAAYREAATYVDKILKGAKPADLPVQQPTKFELVINLKTAKALGLTIPQSLLQRADQVIE
jgi:putative ABC transport system substrate-binding protein